MGGDHRKKAFSLSGVYATPLKVRLLLAVVVVAITTVAGVAEWSLPIVVLLLLLSEILVRTRG